MSSSSYSSTLVGRGGVAMSTMLIRRLAAPLDDPGPGEARGCVMVIDLRPCIRSKGGLPASTPIVVGSSFASPSTGVQEDTEDCEDADIVDPGGLFGGKGTEAGSTLAVRPTAELAFEARPTAEGAAGDEPGKGTDVGGSLRGFEPMTGDG
jgi:hypothetical protein